MKIACLAVVALLASTSIAHAGAAKAAAKAAAAKTDLVDADLSSRGEGWKDWTIKAPKDAKVMEDMGNARVAGKGFDVVISQAAADMAATKDLASKGAEAAKGKITFTTDTPEALEWNLKIGKSTSYYFKLALKVDGKDVTCEVMNTIGAENEKQAAKMKEACKSLAKKQ
jgi:hypothetical protein